MPYGPERDERVMTLLELALGTPWWREKAACAPRAVAIVN